MQLQSYSDDFRFRGRDGHMMYILPHHVADALRRHKLSISLSCDNGRASTGHHARWPSLWVVACALVPVSSVMMLAHLGIANYFRVRIRCTRLVWAYNASIQIFAHTLHWIIIVYTYLKCMNFQSYSDGCALSIIIWVRCGARHMIYYHSTLLMFCDVINFQFASAATTAAPPPATTPGHGHSELLMRW